MLKCLLKRQWKKAVWLILAFCAVFLLQGRIEDVLTVTLLPYQQVYMEKFDLLEKEAFFEQLYNDVSQTQQVYNAIENYENYGGKIPDGEVDLMDQLSGAVQYANYDMLLWQNQMLQMPGRLTDTIQNDCFMTRQLAERLGNQNNFAEILENHKETMRRGLRRSGSLINQYSYTLAQLESIDQNFSVADTYYADQLMKYLESDWYIIVILALAVFGVFSSGNQQKVSNVVLISPIGIQRFAWKQILSSFSICIFCVALYYPLVTFLCCSGDFGAIPWQHPIQIITGYENVLKDMTILEYVLAHIGIKVLFCLMFVSVVLYVSAMSANNVISLFVTVTVCGGLILMNRSDSRCAGLWIGSSNILFRELCYFNVGGQLIDYSLAFGLCIMMFLIVLQGLTVLQCGIAARKWVK